MNFKDGKYSVKDGAKCLRCLTPLSIEQSRKNKFCSKLCASVYAQGRRAWNKGVIDENSKNYYKSFKKSTCERCGFVPEDSCQLDVDHKDGNNKNNNPENLQTLCANCHRLKTKLNRDTRKSIRDKKSKTFEEKRISRQGRKQTGRTITFKAKYKRFGDGEAVECKKHGRHRDWKILGKNHTISCTRCVKERQMTRKNEK